MSISNFTILAKDPCLPKLKGLRTEDIHQHLARVMPKDYLDAELTEYQVTNLRYKPGQKLVMGLTSPNGRAPISLRLFSPGVANRRFKKARSHHLTHTFLLPELDAVAWVFPAERKLDLSILSDPPRLRQLIATHRHLILRDLQLIHFVPEHTYTARIKGIRAKGDSVTEYLKIHYDDSGSKSAAILRDLGSQTASRSIVLPMGPTYIPSEKLLLQPALPRDDKASLSNTAAAHALAVFHGLSTRYARCRQVTESDALRQTEALVAQLFPEQGPALRSLCRDIEDRAERLRDTRHVLIHGDAHLGNLLPLTGNRVGMIDFDRVSWGYPEQDLASFFGFKLWLRVSTLR